MFDLHLHKDKVVYCFKWHH